MEPQQKEACPFCKKEYSSRGSLKKHMTGCSEYNNRNILEVTCRFCNKQLSTKKAALFHSAICKKNPNKTSFTCGYCREYKAKVRTYLLRHFRRCIKIAIKSERNRFCNCTECPLAFKSEDDLEEHKKLHTPVTIPATHNPRCIPPQDPLSLNPVAPQNLSIFGGVSTFLDISEITPLSEEMTLSSA